MEEIKVYTVICMKYIFVYFISSMYHVYIMLNVQFK